MLKRIVLLILLFAVAPLVPAAEMFGARMFTGNFQAEQFTGFNPDYQIAVGDKIAVRIWGAFTFESPVTVDPQGNIFIPSVGPLRVLGVRNAELNKVVEVQLKQTYRSNVGVYTSLEAAVPVKVFVTGYVLRPGLYGGLSSNSVLFYLDKAGGVDPERGSYLDVTVMRGDMVRARINLYDFLVNGRMEYLQLLDGDTIVVGPRKHQVTVSGEVFNPYVFEIASEKEAAQNILKLARARPSATFMSVLRSRGQERTAEYHRLDRVEGVTLEDGDEVIVYADKYPGTIFVRVEGAHTGQRAFVLPYGAKAKDVLAQITPAPTANVEAVQIFRRSMAVRQKEMLQISLRNLETAVLTAKSASNEEAQIRTREAELALQYVERAKSLEPLGRVVIGSWSAAQEVLLEEGDVLRIPERSSLVTTTGEIVFPNSFAWRTDEPVGYYVKLSGGYTQNEKVSRLLVLHQNGVFEDASADSVRIQPGDEIYVLPKIDSKNLEFARAITTIIYQIAIATGVVVDLFQND